MKGSVSTTPPLMLSTSKPRLFLIFCPLKMASELSSSLSDSSSGLGPALLPSS